MYTNIEQIIKTPDWLSTVNEANFDAFALSVFRYQCEHNIIYREYINALGKDPEQIQDIRNIPFLPISFFKTHTILTNCNKEDCNLAFESSGTTGMESSKHFIKDPNLYRSSFLRTFQQLYGDPEEFIFLCLLPSYLERGNSSLVYMADELIRKSKHKESGFYLNEWEQLAGTLQKHKHSGKIILLGVTFALLDFAEKYPMDIKEVIVMETGGMKGRKEEWTRGQVHGYLKSQWQLPVVHSEYGMTELLSQAYALHDGVFKCPPFMKVLAREENDPLDLEREGNGCLNIIDLANIYSCSFIATDDIAKIHKDHSFEVLGRLDNSALRGCSLMVA